MVIPKREGILVLSTTLVLKLHLFYTILFNKPKYNTLITLICVNCA